MAVADAHRGAGDGHVHRLRFQPAVQGGGLKLPLAALQRPGQGLPDLVGQLPHDGPLLGGELAHLLEQSGEGPFFSKIFDPKGVQLLGVSGRLQRGQSFLADLFQCLLHLCSLLLQ